MNFVGGYASRTPFPHDEWRRCVLAALREETTSRGRYADTEGLPALRQAAAQFAGFTRGVRCRHGDLLRAVTTARHLTDWHNTTLVQRALARFIEGGNLARHIGRCHAVYSARRQRLLQRLGGDLSRWLDPIPTAVGSHLSAWLKPGIDVDLLCRLARRVDLGVYSLAPFHAGPVERHGLFFGFGALDSIDIDAALDLLQRILVELDGQT